MSKKTKEAISLDLAMARGRISELEELLGVSIQISPSELENFHDALADINCWMGGFLAGGGGYAPDSIGVLKNLKIKLMEALQKQKRNR